MTLELTDQNFETLVLNNAQPAVIDFMAVWCAPCRVVSMALEIMAEEYDGQAIIGKVDVDTNPELISKFGVRNMPTILYLKDGEVVDRHVGATSKVVLEEKLKAIL
ncbi:thioredoxin domain-containing protein [Fulvivirgaceae bacterium BMA12]|uniref:Thioredoxin n=1 Tax=Agaribacillus aureus TaxID=3051825 RepID=A0ABT8LDQ2_9BACT|nr:thioredoxin domain-containing protein [Fulvivirgaceae bacterium BMA12]